MTETDPGRPSVRPYGSSPRFDDGISLDPSNEVIPNLWIGRWDIQPEEAFAAGFEVVIMLEDMERDRVRPPYGSLFISWPIRDTETELP